ncbi:MAG: KH domain-containing protein, partial [Acidobacteria bacterium]|nr:KH domain-containing protein [Acidobacteriota bacterium]
MSRSRDVVEVIARELADRAEDISVTERDDRDTTYVELSTAGEDLGRMIGRQGRTAASIRVLAGLSGEAQGPRLLVDFLQHPNGPPAAERGGVLRA